LSAGFEGQATDIEIQAREIINVKRRLEEILAEHTRQPRERVSKDMERDYFMTSDEARDTGSSTTSSRTANRGSSGTSTSAETGMSLATRSRRLPGASSRERADRPASHWRTTAQLRRLRIPDDRANYCVPSESTLQRSEKFAEAPREEHG
jgi:hypothetical protein